MTSTPAPKSLSDYVGNWHVSCAGSRHRIRVSQSGYIKAKKWSDDEIPLVQKGTKISAMIQGDEWRPVKTEGRDTVIWRSRAHPGLDSIWTREALKASETNPKQKAESAQRSLKQSGPGTPNSLKQEATGASNLPKTRAKTSSQEKSQSSEAAAKPSPAIPPSQVAPAKKKLRITLSSSTSAKLSPGLGRTEIANKPLHGRCPPVQKTDTQPSSSLVAGSQSEGNTDTSSSSKIPKNSVECQSSHILDVDAPSGDRRTASKSSTRTGDGKPWPANEPSKISDKEISTMPIVSSLKIRKRPRIIERSRSPETAASLKPKRRRELRRNLQKRILWIPRRPNEASQSGFPSVETSFGDIIAKALSFANVQDIQPDVVVSLSHAMQLEATIVLTEAAKLDDYSDFGCAVQHVCESRAERSNNLDNIRQAVNNRQPFPEVRGDLDWLYEDIGTDKAVLTTMPGIQVGTALPSENVLPQSSELPEFAESPANSDMDDDLLNEVARDLTS